MPHDVQKTENQAGEIIGDKAQARRNANYNRLFDEARTQLRDRWRQGGDCSAPLRQLAELIEAVYKDGR